MIGFKGVLGEGKEKEEEVSGIGDDLAENRKIWELQAKRIEELREKASGLERENASLQKN